MGRRRADGSSDFGTGAITSEFRGLQKLDEKFRVQNFTDATYVQGATLRRFWDRPDLNTSDDPTVRFCLVYTPTPRQVSLFCDRCVTLHRQLNPVCTMNIRGKISKFEDPTLLYDFKNPDAAPKFFEEIEGTRVGPPGRSKVCGVQIRMLS